MKNEAHPAKLSAVDLEILKLLWVEHRSNKGGGLLRQEIAERLKEKKRVDNSPLVKTDAALRAHLKDLLERNPTVILFKKAQTNEPGGRPNIYSVDRDNLVTWPSTAYMLIELSRTQPVEHDTFVQRMLQKKVPNSSTGEVATEDGIRRQLKTSHSWNYIDYVNETVMLPSSRLEFELEYLEFVASHLK